MNGISNLLALALLAMGIGLTLYYFPYAFFSLVGWRQRPASLDLAIDEHTQDDNPTLVYEIRAVERDDLTGAAKLIAVFPLPTDNVFRTRDAAKLAIKHVRQTSKLLHLYWHPWFPWVTFLDPVVSPKSRRAMFVGFVFSMCVAIVAVACLLYGNLG